MREIKFRGRDIEGKWLYGDLINSKINNTPTAFIFPPDAPNSYDRYLVNPDTLGQFTGLHDKNGKEIYEGDIVKRERKSLRVRGFPEKTYSEVGYIGFKKNDGRYVMVTSNSEYSLCEPYAVQMEVIGNIHDNPELLNN